MTEKAGWKRKAKEKRRSRNINQKERKTEGKDGNKVSGWKRKQETIEK